MAAKPFKVSNGLAVSQVFFTDTSTSAFSIDSSGNVTFDNNLIVSGTTTTVDSTTLTITDPLITLNKGGGALSGQFVGLEVEENSTATGFFKTDSTGDWTLQGAKNAASAVLTFNIDATSTLQMSNNLTVAATEAITLNQSLSTTDSVSFAGVTSTENLIIGASGASNQKTLLFKGVANDVRIDLNNAAPAAEVYFELPDVTAGSSDKATIITTKNLSDINNITLNQIDISNTGYLKFDGSTADSNKTQLDVIDPEANRTVYLPDATGYLMVAEASGHEDRVTFESGQSSIISNPNTANIFGLLVDGTGGHHCIDATINVVDAAANPTSCTFKLLMSYEDTGTDSSASGVEHAVYAVIGNDTLFGNLNITVERGDSSGNTTNYTYLWLKVQNNGHTSNIKVGYTYEAMKNFAAS